MHAGGKRIHYNVGADEPVERLMEDEHLVLVLVGLCRRW